MNDKNLKNKNDKFTHQQIYEEQDKEKSVAGLIYQTIYMNFVIYPLKLNL